MLGYLIGNLAVVLIILLVLVSLSYLWVEHGTWPDVQIPEGYGVERKPEVYTILPGDSLWGICGKFYPAEDVPEMVRLTKEINGLTSDTIYPYRNLKLPDLKEVCEK